MSLSTAPATERPETLTDANWWRQAAVYQIYPRSFADANGDGIGDLQGITAKVPYLKSLGVDAVWLSPFYPSALADGGYDVADYRDVDPKIGTLDDFDRMRSALHEAGIKLVVDIVPNHSSNEHRWFQQALAAGRGSVERDRYIFREGRGDNGELPPSDWTSIFGGPAWTQVEDGQWYLHLFAPEQPDFNWSNPEVREDFLTTLRFWSDRGVDGFRIDVAHALSKDLSDPLPSEAELNQIDRSSGTHPIWDRDEVHEIYAEWRKLFDSYDPPRTAVAEAWVERHRRPRYASAQGLGQAFEFDLLTQEFDAAAFREVVTDSLELAAESGSSSTWVLSNHDVVRHATRYGLPPLQASVGSTERDQKQGQAWVLAGAPETALDRARGERRARAASLFELALPGSAYLYQGEELGLHEVGDIADEARQDPTFFRNPGVDKGRDGCRVPLPWSSEGSSFGFGSGHAHLPQPQWFGDYSVAAQDGAAGSTLELYRAALRLRRELQGAETLRWLETARPDVLSFERPGGWVVMTNFGTEPVDLPEGELLISSAELVTGALPGEATAWLHR
ncbi:glycoside hydrolase family 13 protein [Glutamicibacter sp. PS]|uniref:glycoside hydrolase family 13 protein n=1 Tax=Glutamicibacter sp. PS TaxID=3075634 RepID=UPI0028410494|nr:glycoside hydrolase family 13 protein [Glutamicibacter sp. PS]MDR4534594.1 glycoside hydrolase family 13 protein [Glutamicibacter sp. PS]